MDTTNNNILLQCDPETGTCEVKSQDLPVENDPSLRKPLQLVYFTDPICSSCWGIEAQLRKLKTEYGGFFDIEYRMGGLLKSWGQYQGNDVRNPGEVAKHWDEAGAYYDMPINGDVWLEDPMDSSFPPSIAFKAAQVQDEHKALVFLRRIKEMVFVEKQNIEKWENLKRAARESGLDTEQLKKDIEGKGKLLFEEDLALAAELGVRGFPTIYFSDEEGNRLKVYGSKPYEVYEKTLLNLFPEAIKKDAVIDIQNMFGDYSSITANEYALLTNKSKPEVGAYLDRLVAEGVIVSYPAKNGNLYKAKWEI